MGRAFFFKGQIPASKSMMNRLLICQSYKEALQILGDSSCDDVVLMKKAMLDLRDSEFPLHSGSAGTVLRFLSCRLSRIPGKHQIMGSERLLSRPQEDLKTVMSQLGVEINLGKDHLWVMAPKAWQIPNEKVLVSRAKSSQFLSGLLLNSWELEKDICFYWQGEVVSDGYLQMTLECLKNLGMEFEIGDNWISVAKGQKILGSTARAESDLSSSFAIAAIAAVSGKAIFEDFPHNSLQPDVAFVEILKQMGVRCYVDQDVLVVEKTGLLNPVQWNLNDCPDLFPVLAVICSVAEGESYLYGAPHLGYKESDRLGKTAELLDKMGKKYQILKDGSIKIYGSSRTPLCSFTYDTDEDHRLAFAAGLAQKIGYQIEVLHPEVVSKSFPEYWDILKGEV